MKDKEKQIEEMGKVMPEKIKDPLDNSRYIIFGKSLRREIARIYYNAGYRKLPEDSVVLSREKYEKLEEKIMNLRYDKQELKNEISEKDSKIALLEETIECIKFNIDYIRKETEERDFNTIIQALEERKDRVIAADIAIRTIKELAKQFGIEIKELGYDKWEKK